MSTTLNKAFGIAPCHQLAAHSKQLSETASIGRTEFITNMRLRRDPNSSNQCTIDMTDPLISQDGGCDIQANPRLALANQQGVIVSAQRDVSVQKTLVVPRERCVLTIADNVSPTSLEIMWSDWSKTQCNMATKPFREEVDRIIKEYHTLYTKHQQVLKDIQDTRESLTNTKTQHEACSAEDERLDIDLPHMTLARQTCDAELKKLREEAKALKEECTAKDNLAQITIRDHTNDIQMINRRLDAASRIYRDANQEMQQKHAILVSTQEHNKAANTQLKTTQQDIITEWSPKRDALQNTNTIRTTDLQTCQANLKRVEADTLRTWSNFVTCEEAQVICDNNLISTRRTVRELNARFAELAEEERKLRQELIKVRSDAELCEAKFKQCQTDVQNHTIEVEEWRRRLRACTQRMASDRATFDQQTQQTLNQLRSTISARAVAEGRMCDAQPQQPQPPLGSNPPPRDMY